MGRIPGVRRVVASLLVMGTAAAGLAVGAGSVGAGSVSAGVGEPNCEVEGPMREPAPEPAPAIIIEPRVTRCATLRVTKVVHGTAPAGATFTVIVQCTSTDERTRSAELPPGQVPPFTTVLTFPETGGTEDVLIAGLSSCTVDEAPPAPGCTLAGVTPRTTEITAPQVYPVFVTNTCVPPEPAAAAATAAAPAAAPLAGSPRFTG